MEKADRKFVVLLPLYLLLVTTAMDATAQGMSRPLDCIISPSAVVDLGSNLPGVIRKITVDRSDMVQTEEVVVELESDIEQISLQLARMREGMTSEIELHKTNRAFGERETKRYERLFQRRAASESELDENRKDTKVAGLKYRQAQDRQQISRLERQRAEEVLRDRTVRSPVDGVIVERYKDVGEYVSGEPIVRVAQLSPLYVEVIAPLQQALTLKPGMTARVWSEQIQGEWQAEVELVDRVADPASGTVGVRLLLDNADYSIPAGIRCKVELSQAKEIASEPSSSSSSFSVAIEQVELSSEIKPLELPADARVTASAAKDLTDPAQCFLIGPVTDQNQLQALTQTLGHSAQLRTEQKEVVIGYKVLSPVLRTNQQISAYKANLKRARVSDYFAFNNSQGEYQISLGLYQPLEPAERYQVKLDRKGVNSYIEPRIRKREINWLNVDIASTELETQMVAYPELPYRICEQQSLQKIVQQ